MLTHLFNHTNTNLIEDIIEDKIYTNTTHNELRPEFIIEMNENINTLRFLLDNGIHVVGVEMGNELTHARYKDLHLSPNEYLEMIKQYAFILRTDEQLSEIKIGVVGEVSLPDFIPNNCSPNNNQIFSSPEQQSVTYNYCWDKTLSDASYINIDGFNYQLFDAFIIHKYFKSSFPNIYNINDIESLAYFMTKVEELKDIYLQNTQNQAYSFKIWFTEWNQEATVISNTRKSENTRYIYDVYSFLSQYNAINFDVFEYVTFHNFLGSSPISLLNLDLTQRDNIKAHYLIQDIEDLVGTTSTQTSNISVAKGSDYKFLDINVSGNKFWLKDYALLAWSDGAGGYTPIQGGPCGSVCWQTTLYKVIYFIFNNSTNNSYCINPTFKNTNTAYSVVPNSLTGSTLSPDLYAYLEDPATGTAKGFLNTPTSTNSNIIPPKSIGYLRYAYSFDPVYCYPGYRIANNFEETTSSTNTSIAIYPNPVQNRLFITGIDVEKIKTVTIYDAQGKISTYPIDNNEIDISDLMNGLYFLSLADEGVVFHQKFVVQK